MVNFDNVTSNVQSKPRKKTMAESLEEAKQEGRLVVPEEDKQENAVVSIETVQSKSDKPKKKKKVKVRKDGEQTVTVSQEDNDFKDAKTDKRGVPVGINVPQHILDVVCIVKFNAAFRRHTSLNILHTLEDDGRINNSKGAYVDFLWNKFRVTADGGLRREYRYTEDLFIDALVKAHADVATDNQKVINSMIDTEAELNKAKSPD
ncbi:hypothetical protein [uncultured phage cr99_1]|jgi:hypothetical protein|uniref:Uncharacterized protein n=1 Tax=uncultured phage cr99_1 TaxID=2986399 RepID=A0AAE7V420_9CAUD|nr:hypothetical protein M1M49_gp62 [uncultured phage cr99_1]QWM89712.1 hypothetical protein [uncultured phage cr99_1]